MPSVVNEVRGFIDPSNIARWRANSSESQLLETKSASDIKNVLARGDPTALSRNRFQLLQLLDAIESLESAHVICGAGRLVEWRRLLECEIIYKIYRPIRTYFREQAAAQFSCRST